MEPADFEYGLEGLRLVQLGVMWLRELEHQQNPVLVGEVLSQYMGWESQVDQWREKLTQHDPLPTALADINENLLYIADKFTKL